MQLPVLELKPSRWILGWLGIIHGLAGAAVGLATLSIGWRFALLGVVAVSLAISLALEWLRDGQLLVPQTLTRWWLGSINKGKVQADLIDAQVFRHVVILHFRVFGRWWPRTIVVASDAVDADSHRRLRAALKTEGVRQ